MPEPLAYLNGRWIFAADAAVPVRDAGFILGTSVAEQLAPSAGGCSIWPSISAAGAIARDCGHRSGAWAGRFCEACRGTGRRESSPVGAGDDLMLSIVVTPGTHLNFLPPKGSRPSVYLHTFPLPFDYWAENYRTG